MKTNQIYVLVAVVVIIGMAVFLGKGEKKTEVDSQIVDSTDSLNTNTQNTNPTSGVQKPSSSTTKLGPVGNTSPGTPSSVPSIPTAASLNGSVFKLTSHNGNPVSADTKYTLSFNGDTLSAKLCNNMSGNFVLDGNLLKVSNFSSTKMACSTPANLMAIESDFNSMLNYGAMIYQSGNTIILSYAKGAVMVFTGF